jgi:hypothetical protein
MNIVFIIKVKILELIECNPILFQRMMHIGVRS